MRFYGLNREMDVTYLCPRLLAKKRQTDPDGPFQLLVRLVSVPLSATRRGENRRITLILAVVFPQTRSSACRCGHNLVEMKKANHHHQKKRNRHQKPIPSGIQYRGLHHWNLRNTSG